MFCFGVFLAVLAHVVLVEVSNTIWMQIVVSAVGIAMMTVLAYYRSWSKDADKKPAKASTNSSAGAAFLIVHSSVPHLHLPDPTACAPRRRCVDLALARASVTSSASSLHRSTKNETSGKVTLHPRARAARNIRFCGSAPN